jgi:diguanylate cyclase (GGDEF)-like protein
MEFRLKRLVSTVLPGAALLGASIVLVRGVVPSVAVDQVGRYAMPVVFALGLLLSAAFRRSRIFLALFMLALADVTMVWLAPRFPRPGTAHVVANCIAMLLPLNLVALSFAKERGVLTSPGLRKFGVIALQVFAVAVIATPSNARAAILLNVNIVRHRYTQWTNLPQLALVMFVLAAVVLLVRTAQRRRTVDTGLLWALVAAFLALNFTHLRGVFNLYVATAGLVLVVTVLETSYAMAYRDELTDLPGRRAFNEALAGLGSTYAIAMIDVDHFKKFNDKYGHEAGDQVLHKVAGKLATIQGGGSAFRYGGEEFAIVFAGRTLDEAFPHIERVRQSIADSPFVVRSGSDRRKRAKTERRRGRAEITVTVSIGVAAAENGEMDPDHVLQAADKALYRAKAAGRNCTVAVDK